jgi:hypothetical protein
MENVIIKFLVIEVDGEAAFKFPYPSIGQERFEMMEAVLASNHTVRLVDTVQVGDIWNGTEFVTPS